MAETIGWVVVVFVLVQAVFFAGFRIYGLLVPGDKSYLSTPFALMVISAAMYTLMLVVLLVVPQFRMRRLSTTSDELAFHGLPTWRDVSLPFLAFAVYMLLTWLLVSTAQSLIPGFDVTQAQNLGFTRLEGIAEYAVAFTALIILAPLAEELIFRGYIYGRFKRFGMPAWAIALAVSALFGLVHMQPNVMVDTFALSLVLCGLREMTGSIWAGIVLHALKNFVAFYLLFVNAGLFSTIGS